MTTPNLTSEQLKALLSKSGACRDAVAWIGTRDLATAWRKCERGDWMLWLCGKMIGRERWPSRQELVNAACDCAETSLKYVQKGEMRPAKAIETARAWTRGEATIEDVRNAADAADAAYAAYAADAAAYAANVAANAAYAAAYAAYAANAAYAAYAAAYAAYAAAYAANVAANAAYAAYAAAYAANLQCSADLVRHLLSFTDAAVPVPIVVVPVKE